MPLLLLGAALFTEAAFARRFVISFRIHRGARISVLSPAVVFFKVTLTAIYSMASALRGVSD
jgi:hypothetical protein